MIVLDPERIANCIYLTRSPHLYLQFHAVLNAAIDRGFGPYHDGCIVPDIDNP